MPKYADLILNIINQSNLHLTAEDIYLQLKAQNSKVALATIYNNLKVLCEEKKIAKLILPDQPDRYDRVARHDHLICKHCNAVSDLFLENISDQLQAQLPIQISDYDLKIHYTCPKCSSKGYR